MRRPSACSGMGLCALLAWSSMLATVSAQSAGSAHGEVSLGTLLRGSAQRDEPELEVFDALLSELRARPHTSDAAARSVAQASLAVAEVRALQVRGAATAEQAACKQAAWAALSLADRELAYVGAEQALREADARLGRLSHSQSAPVPARVGPRDEAAMARLAPDFLARVQRAEAAMRDADGRAMSRLLEQRATLLRAAAAAEASRIALRRIAAAYEARALELEKAEVAAGLARMQARTEGQTLQSAAETSQRVRQAFEEIVKPAARTARSVSGSDAHGQAAELLLGRARLVLAGARVLGGDAVQAQAQAAQRAIEQAGSTSARAADPTAAVLRALGASWLALGGARAARATPAEDTRADLVARTGELGLAVSCSDAGAEVRLPDAFLPRQAGLRAEQARRLALLAALLAAYPHGEVQVASCGPGDMPAALRRRRAAGVAAQLGRTLGAARVRVVDSECGGVGADDFALILPAYAMLAAP